MDTLWMKVVLVLLLTALIVMLWRHARRRWVVEYLAQCSMRLYAYAGYDTATLLAGRAPTSEQLFRGLENEKALLCRRARILAERLKPAANTESTATALECLERCEADFTLILQSTGHAIATEQLMEMAKRIIEPVIDLEFQLNEAPLQEKLRAWREDALQWILAQIIFDGLYASKISPAPLPLR